MSQKKYLIKIVSGTVVAGLLITASASAFASSGQDTTSNKPSYENKMNMGGKGHGMKGARGDFGFQNMLPELVKDGTLTQSESDKITQYIKDLQEQRKTEMDKIKSMTEEQRKAYFDAQKSKNIVKKTDMLSELVTKGILTQQKADAVKTKMNQKREEQRAARLTEITNNLNALVKKGTITQDQSAKILEGIKNQESERKAEMDKIKSMTKEQRDAYFKSQKGQKTNFLKTLVDNKTLTQDQADAVRKAIRNPGKPHKGGMPRMEENTTKNN